MPELPEVEITARRLDASLAGVEVESAIATGMVALKSVDPPLGTLRDDRSRACAGSARCPWSTSRPTTASRWRCSST